MITMMILDFSIIENIITETLGLPGEQKQQLSKMVLMSPVALPMERIYMYFMKSLSAMTSDMTKTLRMMPMASP